MGNQNLLGIIKAGSSALTYISDAFTLLDSDETLSEIEPPTPEAMKRVRNIVEDAIDAASEIQIYINDIEEYEMTSSITSFYEEAMEQLNGASKYLTEYRYDYGMANDCLYKAERAIKSMINNAEYYL